MRTIATTLSRRRKVDVVLKDAFAVFILSYDDDGVFKELVDAFCTLDAAHEVVGCAQPAVSQLAVGQAEGAMGCHIYPWG